MYDRYLVIFAFTSSTVTLAKVDRFASEGSGLRYTLLFALCSLPCALRSAIPWFTFIDSKLALTYLGRVCEESDAGKG
jgi:hypothetical protein